MEEQYHKEKAGDDGEREDAVEIHNLPRPEICLV